MGAGGRGVLALVAAAVLGIAGGVSVAFVAPVDLSDAGPTFDPLNLGIPRVDLDCTGESILVVGYGERRTALAAVVADSPGQDVRYLSVADSCRTLYAPDGKPVPDYVAYFGPYDSLGEACAERMNVAHKGDNVTRLNDGNEIFVRCVCELPVATFPLLGVGLAATAEDGIWIRNLQEMLFDFGRLDDDAITGAFDERTAAEIRTIQTRAAVPADGRMDPVTWKLLRDRVCGSYDY